MTEDEKQNEYNAADWLRDTEWYWFHWQPPHAAWDHDHCFFCHTRISDDPLCTDALRDCWRYDYPPDDEGSYETICPSCFDTLKSTFRWRVVAAPLPN